MRVLEKKTMTDYNNKQQQQLKSNNNKRAEF